MSGAIKAGLLFGLIGLAISLVPPPIIVWATALPLWLARICVQIIPALMIFGPLALVLGSCAGYFGTRWSRPPTFQRGLLAGGVAGGGVMLGILVFFATILLLLASTPDIRDALVRMTSEGFAAQGGNEQVVTSGFTALLVAAGLCTGVVNLVVALGAGALAGWFASRIGSGGAPQREDGAI